MTPDQVNGADMLCDILLLNGTDVCFANPGTSEMHFVAALDRKPQMRCVLGLFEGVVTGAADGYARMADRPAATLLHTGPGLANALANMHNAKRAQTPMINVVGDHASYHLELDAPLTSDIESLAHPMSDFVRRIDGADDVARATSEAIAAATRPPGGVATLILPADAAWTETAAVLPQPVQTARPGAPSEERIAEVAEALKAGGETVLLLSGAALRAEAMERAFAIAAKCGASVMAQQSNARMARGLGRFPLERVPYPVDLALQRFSGTRRVILVGARAPVAFFAYPGKPGSMLPADCDVQTLADPGEDLGAALAQLADRLGVGTTPIAPARATMADLPSGPITTESLAIAVGRALPENAILCDESISSGRDFFALTHGAAAHDHLQLTGGAIGVGLPMAVGAAIACPDRKVVALQADGSAMYTNQALWTMARENLDIVVVLLANRQYAILRNELKAVGASEPGRNAQQMLNLDAPDIDWVALARGMGVEATRVDTSQALADRLAAAMGRSGPFLIEAVL